MKIRQFKLAAHKIHTNITLNAKPQHVLILEYQHNNRLKNKYATPQHWNGAFLLFYMNQRNTRN